MSIIRYENLKIMPLITRELFNRNLQIVHPTLFFNFVIAPPSGEDQSFEEISDRLKTFAISMKENEIFSLKGKTLVGG